MHNCIKTFNNEKIFYTGAVPINIVIRDVDTIFLFKKINYKTVHPINFFLLFNDMTKFKRLMYRTLDLPLAHFPVEPYRIGHQATIQSSVYIFQLIKKADFQNIIKINNA